VRVYVDDSGHERKPAGIDGFARGIVAVRKDNAAVPDADVGDAAGGAGAIDHARAADEQVEHLCMLPRAQ